MRYIIPAIIALTAPAMAQQPVQNPPSGECVKGSKSCVIVTMTPEEIQTLTGPNGVFATAEWGNRVSMAPLVEAWKQKIASSPAGKVPEEPKPDAKKEQKK